MVTFLVMSSNIMSEQITLTALGEMFEAARGIMNWLGDCAKVSLFDPFLFLFEGKNVCFYFMAVYWN